MSEEESESKVGIAIAVGCGIFVLLGGLILVGLYFGARTLTEPARMRAENALRDAQTQAAAERAAQQEAEAAAKAAQEPTDSSDPEEPAGD